MVNGLVSCPSRPSHTTSGEHKLDSPHVSLPTRKSLPHIQDLLHHRFEPIPHRVTSLEPFSTTLHTHARPTLGRMTSDRSSEHRAGYFSHSMMLVNVKLVGS